MGPGGSGKSTLMHCIAGLDKPTFGRVLIGNTDIATVSDKTITAYRRDRLGFIFQAFNLVPILTAKESILLPRAIAGKKSNPKWFKEIVHRLGLTKRLDHRLAELSGD